MASRRRLPVSWRVPPLDKPVFSITTAPASGTRMLCTGFRCQLFDPTRNHLPFVPVQQAVDAFPDPRRLLRPSRTGPAPDHPPEPPGCRLPTVRDLASQLDLAPDTTVQAYQELERDGVAEGRGGRGTFVVDDPPTPTLWRSAARGSTQQRGGAPGPRPRPFLGDRVSEVTDLPDHLIGVVGDQPSAP